MSGAGSAAGALVGPNLSSLLGALDRLQYRSRIESARTLVADLRSRGAVPALLDAGARFGVANRALLGR